MAKNDIVIIGDSMVEKFIRGDTIRCAPEAPVPVIINSKVTSFPGGSGNVAVNVQALTGNAHLLAVIGRDAVGIQLKNDLDAFLLSYQIVEDGQRQTTEKQHIITENFQIGRIDNEDTMDISQEVADMLIKTCKEI